MNKDNDSQKTSKKNDLSLNQPPKETQDMGASDQIKNTPPPDYPKKTLREPQKSSMGKPLLITISILALAFTIRYYNNHSQENKETQQINSTTPKELEAQPSTETKASKPKPTTEKLLPPEPTVEDSTLAILEKSFSPAESEPKNAKQNTFKEETSPATPINASSPENTIEVTEDDNISLAQAAKEFVHSMQILTVLHNGSKSKVIINGKTFHLGEIVDPNTNLKWDNINVEKHRVYLIDGEGNTYSKKY